MFNTYVHSDLIHKSYNVEASTDGRGDRGHVGGKGWLMAASLRPV